MPEVMGILNVTPDSFSDGGQLATVEEAVAAGLRLVAEGAAWLDIGGESTRPGAQPVSDVDEIQRTIPVIAALRQAGCRAGISIDTRRGAVATAALAAGATLVNDVSGGDDASLLAAVAAAGAHLALMHHRGLPATLAEDTETSDMVAEVIAHLQARVARAVAAGVARHRIYIDPGIGFGKTVAQNLALLRRLEDLRTAVGCPILLGISRKRFLAMLGGTAYPAPDSMGQVVHALVAPTCALLRVHDVRGTMIALRHAGAA